MKTNKAARHGAVSEMFLAAVLTTTVLMHAPAFGAEAQQSETIVEFSIPKQRLATALQRFAETTGLQLVYPPELVADLQSAPVSGKLSPVQALAQLLGDSGLSYRFANKNTVTLQKSAEGARTLAPVRVEGVDRAALAGVNGSTDPTATEGTRSYTTGLMSIASKTPQSIKDTPQSVSVITQQRMQDQNITDFESAMREAPGVTVLTSGTYGASYFARGFLIDTFQIDGGAPLATTIGQIGRGSGTVTNLVPQIDMAMYDHVEVLRGADGLLNGYGDPGGTINLVRKRPLSHGKVSLQGQVGSWGLMRTVIDAGGPLGFDGRLRGRGVTSYQDNEFYYDIASHSQTTTYGMLEFDVTSDTLLSGGFSVSRVDGVPGNAGLPRYLNGDDLKLPRSTCLCFPWNRTSFDTTELFTQLQQNLPGDWSLKLNLMRVDQEGESKTAGAQGAVLDASGSGSRIYGQMATGGSVQDSADLSVNGTFELFGSRQQITAGANYQKVDSYGTQNGALYGGRRIDNIFVFDPHAYPEPAATEQLAEATGFGQTQWGAYVNAKLTVLSRLHVGTGLRYSDYRFQYPVNVLCTSVRDNCRFVGDVRSRSIQRYSGSDFSWPPTYSLSYDLAPNVSLYGGYTDTYQSQADFVDSSLSPLDPSTGSNAQLGVNVELAGGKMNATFGVYYMEQKNFPLFLNYGDYANTGGLLPDGQRKCCYENSGDFMKISQGVDMEFGGEVLPGWQLTASYSYNSNEYKGEQFGSRKGLPLVSLQPEHLFKLSTSYRVNDSRWWRPFSVGGSLHGQSKAYEAGVSCLVLERYGNQTFCTNEVPYDYTQRTYAIARLHMSVEVTRQWQVMFAVDNVTDKHYYQTMGSAISGNVYGEPRGYQLTVTGTF